MHTQARTALPLKDTFMYTCDCEAVHTRPLKKLRNVTNALALPLVDAPHPFLHSKLTQSNFSLYNRPGITRPRHGGWQKGRRFGHGHFLPAKRRGCSKGAHACPANRCLRVDVCGHDGLRDFCRSRECLSHFLFRIPGRVSKQGRQGLETPSAIFLA